ncbi:hypothetical protein FHS83_001324 [Rhizomicrobium palustre]|uniref:JmjC domain-containing protein n=1 Tax=Rhizomicrobium palustre TaxID=189966 RepID=A0A846MX71_9PROT|nr:hypothetical protein [Rhizomicrobium palustre]
MSFEFGALTRVREWHGVTPEIFHDQIIPADQPAVLKGLVADWPIVRAATTSSKGLYEYLRAHDSGRATTIFVAEPSINGAFFYRDDMSGLNFERRSQPLQMVAANLVALSESENPPALYAPAAVASETTPSFTKENPLPLVAPDVEARLWLGNAITAPTHYDMEDGIACVVAGRRRFTFFPPDQLPNLYIGPLDMAPGGLPTSLVKASDPDFARFPRYREALKVAQAAELEPGDAIFIPNMWWHNVESLDRVNLLVNYWWFEGTRGAASPFSALALGLMAIPPLPESRRAVWRQMFEHYVFRSEGDPVPYLPADKRGMLGTLTPDVTRYMRTQIVRSLTRSLPAQIREQIQRWVSASP